VRFQLSELRKAIRPGDHVKVTAGRHEGKSGTVLTADATIVTVSCDLSYERVRWRSAAAQDRDSISHPNVSSIILLSAH